MSCEQFKKFELGEIDSREFREHLKVCPDCRDQEQLDSRLMNLSRWLKEPVQSPGLWERIEHTLKEEEHQRSQPLVIGVSRRSFTFYLAAAVMFIAVAVGIFFWLLQGKHEPGLLTEAALKKIEVKEHEYIKAIEELERQTLPRMASMNIELMLLYRDRLETIDDQIRRCREALSENPANTHIRRYMLAALQDKKETLRELTGQFVSQ
ncbi:MAG: zf-HC2 domain-containing protein [Candidatus Aminicenantes bacterium]|nr:MAG: zf-HC2 domain-containing protein [Candidatus Aminicenantes bacterium]